MQTMGTEAPHPSLYPGTARDFSLNTTGISRDSAWLSSFLTLWLASPDIFRLRSRFGLGLGRRPLAPDVVEFQYQKPHQRLPPSPLVTHLLPEPNPPVGPLDVIVRPHPPTDRALEIRHHLGELLDAQLLHRLDQLRHC